MHPKKCRGVNGSKSVNIRENAKNMAEKLKSIFFYIVLFLFILAFNTTAVDYDYDLWARLIAGMSIVQTGHILKHDFLSYTSTHLWIDHEWGSSVIFYLAQHFFSSAGILMLQAALIFSIFFMMTKVVNLRGVKTTSAYNFLFYYFAFMAISYNLNDPIRCQLFSFLFFTVFLYILERFRLGKSKKFDLIVYLPLIMLFWNNLHGGSVAGIGLIILYIIGEFFNKKPIKIYIYALIPTIAVLFINPWGAEFLKFLFQANTMQRTYIAEWFGIFSSYFNIIYMKFKIFALVLLLVELGVVIKQIYAKTFNFDKTKFLILLTTLILAVQHIKLIPFAIISMVCFLYDDFYTAFNTLTRNLFNRISMVKDTIVYGIILSFALVNINAKAFQPLVSLRRFPSKSIEFIKINKINGNLLTNFGFGSYASYKLYPNNKIFMDGRYEEVYFDDMVPMLQRFYRVKPGWQDVLKKFPPDVMIIEKFYPIYQTLCERKEWKLIFDDNFFGVFVSAKNAKKLYKQPESDLEYYKKTLFDTDINFVLKSRYESGQ